jgi:hypothetical protein
MLFLRNGGNHSGQEKDSEQAKDRAHQRLYNLIGALRCKHRSGVN